ncbi:MAG: hypothetical protein FJX42_03065 [Alphaproteobacteria bacterium]|nr:hypothetical protein [Alphaproteobacteria bacterium]
MRKLLVAIALSIPFFANAALAADPLAEGEVRIANLKVPGQVVAGNPYTVTFEGIEKAELLIALSEGCFSWDSEDPYCFRIRENPTAKTVTALLRTNNPSTYNLSGYITYPFKGETRRSNTVRARLVVTSAANSPSSVSESAPLTGGEVRIAKLKIVPEEVVVGKPYTVTFEGIEKAEPSIALSEGCFFWGFQGPFCFKIREDVATKSAQVNLRARDRAKVYTLSGHITYSYKGNIRQSNTVHARLAFTPF